MAVRRTVYELLVALDAILTDGTYGLAALETIVDDLEGRLTAGRAGNLDDCSWLETTHPIQMNCTEILDNTAADAIFVTANTLGASGLISTTNADMQKAFLLIIGRAVNDYAGTNALDCATAAHNQWQMALDGGAFADLTNATTDGQMLDNDWRCPVEGAIHPFTFMFDITAVLTNNIDGNIGVQLDMGRAEQEFLIVTIDVYLKVIWKL